MPLFLCRPMPPSPHSHSLRRSATAARPPARYDTRPACPSAGLSSVGGQLARHRTALLLAATLTLAACSVTPPPRWQVQAQGATQRATDAWLHGRTAVAAVNWQHARRAVADTGQSALLARITLMECAVRAAALQWTHCPAVAFEAAPDTPSNTLPDTASTITAEAAYARYLAGRPLPADLPHLPAAQQDTARALLTPPQSAEAATATPRAPYPLPRLPAPSGPSTLQRNVSNATSDAATASSVGWLHAMAGGTSHSLSQLVAASVSLRAALLVPATSHDALPVCTQPINHPPPKTAPAEAGPLATPRADPAWCHGIHDSASALALVQSLAQRGHLPSVADTLYMADIAAARGWRTAARAWLLLAQALLIQPTSAAFGHPPASHAAADIAQRLHVLETAQ